MFRGFELPFMGRSKPRNFCEICTKLNSRDFEKNEEKIETKNSACTAVRPAYYENTRNFNQICSKFIFHDCEKNGKNHT